MSQQNIIDPVSGVAATIDRAFKALRVGHRPIDHGLTAGGVLGHYMVAQESGALAATIGAAGHLASIRNSHASYLLIPTRIRVGWVITGAVTTAVPMDLQGVIARGFTVDFTTASTAANMAAVTKTNAMRASMAASMLGTVGPRIATTTVMSGQTLTADANPFAIVNWNSLTSVTATGTAVALQAGTAGTMTDLYNINNAAHPIVLGNNEGIIIQPHTAGPATGTYNIYVEWSWAEVEAY